MTSALIGYTGFVGSNLLNSHKFDDLYNSKNIHTIKDKDYDLVVCSGVPANMNFANKDPEGDLANINQLLNNLQKAHIKKIILISSTAVYSETALSPNENSCDYETKMPYGIHRRYLEQQIIDHSTDYHIIRLPALFGKNLKKNLINDILNREPAFMPASKFDSLLEPLSGEEQQILNECYSLDKVKNIRILNKHSSSFNKLLPILIGLDFTALEFTNAESVYQFYSLSNLWKDTNMMMDNHISELNICSEPLKAKEIVRLLTKEDFSNHRAKIFNYHMQTIHANLWNEYQSNYLYSAKQVKKELLSFYQEYKGISE